MRVLKEYTESLTGVITTDTSVNIDLEGAEMLSIQSVIDVNTPAAATFTAAVTDICTATAHGFVTGLKVQVSSTTTLPAGLSGATDYFVVKIDADTFKLSDTLAHALAGTNLINITDTGTGTHTITPTSIAGGSIKLQKSNDNSNWSDEGSATNITADATVWLEKDRPSFKRARVYITLTAGMLAADFKIVTKG